MRHTFIRASIPLLLLGAWLVAGSAAHARLTPEIQHWVSDSGARVYFVQTDALPIVDVRVVFDAAAARDGDRHGLAALTNGLLTEGAGDLDSREIAQRVESVGARLSRSALRDMAVVSLRSLADRDRLETALNVMETVLAEPRFPADALERRRDSMLVNLNVRSQDPGNVASDAFYEGLYDGHPYAHGPEGTEEGLASVSRREVVEFYQRYYVAPNAVVAVVGDLTRDDAEAIAERLTRGLPRGERAPALPEPRLPDAASTVAIDFPSSQTHLLLGHPALRRNDPDYFPLYVGNHILGGGGFTSRLMEEVREKRGLSYSVSSYFVPMAQQGPLRIGLQTANDQAELALEVLRENVTRFRAEGPTAEELEKAKLNITGSFPLNIDSNSNIVSYLGMIGFYDLTLDYLERYTARVEAVTVEQIRSAFGRRVHPDRMVTVVVGGAEATGPTGSRGAPGGTIAAAGAQ